MALGSLVAVVACKGKAPAELSVGACMTPDSCVSWRIRDEQASTFRSGCDGLHGRWIDGACPTTGALGGCRDRGPEPQEQWFYSRDGGGVSTLEDVKARASPT